MFHGDEGSAVFFANLVDGANIGMVQRGRCPGLAAKTFQRLRVLRQFIRKEFQYDKAIPPLPNFSIIR
jgi:hypothetical protein